MRCGLRAGWRDGSERLCPETDESSTHYNRRHTSSESGVSAPAQEYDMINARASDRSDQSFEKPFCQGEPGAMGLSRMPMARNRRMTSVP
jgi:hypothetical protein